jgi:hypothetical protein
MKKAGDFERKGLKHFDIFATAFIAMLLQRERFYDFAKNITDKLYTSLSATGYELCFPSKTAN